MRKDYLYLKHVLNTCEDLLNCILFALTIFVIIVVVLNDEPADGQTAGVEDICAKSKKTSSDFVNYALLLLKQTF